MFVLNLEQMKQAIEKMRSLRDDATKEWKTLETEYNKMHDNWSYEQRENKTASIEYQRGKADAYDNAIELVS